jgi:hypothetical protein
MRNLLALCAVGILFPVLFVSADVPQSRTTVLAQLYSQLQFLQSELQQLTLAPSSTGVLASGTYSTQPVPPHCDSLTLASTVITAGQSTKLTWRTSYATKVYINTVGDVALDGSTDISPTASTDILLTATNDQTKTKDFCKVTLQVKPAPAVKCDSFTTSATSLVAGNPATLKWSTTNAVSATLSPGVGAVTPDGSHTVSPTTTTTYKLTATNASGVSAVCSAPTITVKPAPTPTCDSFTVGSTSLTVGKSTTIKWATTNAVSATLSPGFGSVTPDGSQTVTPTTTTTYTLTAKNASGVSVTCKAPTFTVTPVKPNLSFCFATQKTAHGTLCAIQPSKIDSRTLDKAATGTITEADKGFGYHVFAVPDNWSGAKGVWVHFTGSYGRPYDQTSFRTQSGTVFSDPLFMDEIMEKGYTVLQPAYDNEFSVGDLCGRATDGYNIDNCSGAVREMSLTGQGNGAGKRYDDQYNTIDYRLKKMVGYIEDVQKIQLPDTISSSSIDWSKLEVSGHSQGADQTFYIAKKRLVHSACILAGTYDNPDTVKPYGTKNVADWYTATATIMTPKSSIRAVMTTTDPGYDSFYTTLTTVVDLPTTQIFVDTTSPYNDVAGNVLDGHAATIKDPSLKTIRANACFANLP